MKEALLWLYGFVLLVVSGAVCKVFHLEWMRPDPTLLMVVYVALVMPAGQGVWWVFSLGMVTDSLASTPMGLLTTGYVLIWVVVRGVRRILLPERLPVRLAILGCMALLQSGWLMAMLAFMEAGSEPVWLMFKAAIPLALLNLALAVPVWALARRILTVKDRRVLAGP